MKKFRAHSDIESPFWMVRLILHGITTLVSLVMVISGISVVVTNFFVKNTTFGITPGILIAAPGVIAFCYHFPQWVCVIVGEAHRGMPPYFVIVADVFFFLAFAAVSIVYGATGAIGHAFNDHGAEVFFARGCVISAFTGAVIHLVLSAIAAYDIFHIRRTHKEQVYLVTSYHANDDLATGYHPTSYGGLKPPPVRSYGGGYHSRGHSVDMLETHALNHQRTTSVV